MLLSCSMTAASKPSGVDRVHLDNYHEQKREIELNSTFSDDISSLLVYILLSSPLFKTPNTRSTKLILPIFFPGEEEM